MLGELRASGKDILDAIQSSGAARRRHGEEAEGDCSTSSSSASPKSARSMPSLKDMRARMNSVRQTRKITSAMKLVAASKLRRAQEQAEASRPFAERMTAMLQNLAAGVAGLPGAPPLLAGTGKDEVHLLIVATADRGLCGGFNSTIVRGARRRIQELLAARQAGQADRRRQEGPRHAAPRPARPDRRVLRRHRRQAADRVSSTRSGSPSACSSCTRPASSTSARWSTTSSSRR